MDLSTSISSLGGIGTFTAKKLANLNINTVQNLIYHFPFRYDDFSQNTAAAKAKIGEQVTLVGEIWSIKNIRTRYGKFITQVIFNDGTSPITLTWFNQSWLAKQLQTGDKLQISGKLSNYKNKLSIIAPVWEKHLSISQMGIQNLHTGRLVPIYPETAGLNSKWMRTKINSVLKSLEITEFLPNDLRQNLISEQDAILKIHFPNSWDDVRQAKARLSFDEVFLAQLSAQQTRQLWQKKTVVKPWKISDNLIKNFTKSLPFTLTKAQQRVISEVIMDLKKETPMNRLLQGEVGSGKTVVAALIIYLSYKNGFQSVFMAPTEILAWQHFETIKNLLEPLGLQIGLYTGSKKIVASDVMVGTHALLSDKLSLDKIGMVVIDEQHRFGVEQRAILRQKGSAPHLLTMTATPIPRTVALTVYGDLDISIIDELPKNRIRVKTHLVPESKRQNAYKFMQEKIDSGDQIYVVTPLIEESIILNSLKAAKLEYEKLKDIFPKIKIGLLHGQMTPKEKSIALSDFKSNRTQILVSTTVVEVGVDIPNATIMIIEAADKFGLAQLHQLRGRVGRGDKQSYCFLFTSDGKKSNSRLKYLESTFDGLKLAELDLKIRGSGTIFDIAQHGQIEFKLADLSDVSTIQQAREMSYKLLKEDLSLDKYPLLKAKLQSISRQVMPD